MNLTKRQTLTGLAIVATAGAILAGTAIVVNDVRDAKPRVDLTMPTPVPIPGTDTMVMEPRKDVLTYVVMSDLWAGYTVTRQENTCVLWQGGFTVNRKGDLVEKSQDAIVADELDRVSRDQADWMEHGTVRLFLDETCAEVLSHGEIGTAESREQGTVGESGATRKPSRKG